MRYSHLTILAIATIVTVGCTREITSNSSATETSAPAKTSAAEKTTAPAKSGSFQKSEHPTEGTVTIVAEKEKRYLEFDQKFKTNQGPDLFVILYRGDTPPITGIEEKDYVSIAKLKDIKGTQRYAVPDQVNLSDFRTVAIWCRKFNATFGYASLPK